MEQVTRKVNKIIVHCSATKEGKNFNAQDIDRWHKERGFKKIGYHYVVGIEGEVERGRMLSEIGAHVRGHNRDSVGICYIGGLDERGKPKDTRTPEQINALHNLLDYLTRMFPDATIYGHRDFDPQKACPCFEAKDYNQRFFPHRKQEWTQK
ncbi:N-acetylmuramoyl-L-alanine amidase [Helicobacter salomonis]|uniref:N-acetylmuramoyl-L-alanine amidase n=1 Tax=Helicobacter salomonis TaxID=56878 RepID=UPI000CF15CC2|nr:N-acetylmuramoyl-L-alanine amidase [Helicobacter salomonis]